jgi:hypothetical protein
MMQPIILTAQNLLKGHNNLHLVPSETSKFYCLDSSIKYGGCVRAPFLLGVGLNQQSLTPS